MKIVLRALFIFIIFSPKFGVSQDYKYTKFIDSLIEVTNKRPDDSLKVAGYGKLYEMLMFRDPEMSFSYAKKEHGLSKQLDYKIGLASSQLHFADYYKDRGLIDSARQYYAKSKQIYTDINSTIGTLFVNHSMATFERSLGNYDKALTFANTNIDLYKNRDTVFTEHGKTFNLIGAEYELLGGIHQELGNYRIALKETLNALEFYGVNNDTIRQADALMQIGTLELTLENFESAIAHTTEAFDIYGKYDDKQYKSYAANTIGNTYLSMQKPELALEYFEEALQLSKEIKNKELVGSSLVNMGMARMAMGYNKEAIDFFMKGLAIHEELGYKKIISMDLNSLAEAQIKGGNLKMALVHLDRSIAIAKQIGAKNNLSQAYGLRYAAYKSLGNPQIALADHENYKAINDTIYNTTKSQQIEELRTIYETEKKEQQLALQDKEITVLEQEAKISNQQRLLLGGGMTLSMLALGFGFYGFRQRTKKNSLEKEKVEAELAFKKKQLTTHALHLAKKNEVLENVKLKAKDLKSQGDAKGYQELIKTINFDQQDDKNWESFTQYFEQVHKDFAKNVKDRYPEVTKNELRFMALLKMNMSSKEIATILNISPDGIKKARQRLRKKMALTPEDSLENAVLAI